MKGKDITVLRADGIPRPGARRGRAMRRYRAAETEEANTARLMASRDYLISIQLPPRQYP